jgi:hypothetical protein
MNTILSWNALQARARSCEAENNMTGALDYYNAAVVAFPTPNSKDFMAKSILRRLENERNQCRDAVCMKEKIGINA